jgi:hypothetical protein
VRQASAGRGGAAALSSKTTAAGQVGAHGLWQAADADGVAVLSNITYVELLANNPVQRSLSAIKRAHFQLRSLKAASATSEALMSQIALCDLILGEISIIRAGLAEGLFDIQYTHQDLQIPLRFLN